MGFITGSDVLQAARDYARVTGEEARRVMLQGRDSAAELAGERLQVFAMVWTLGNAEVLKRLPRDYFEYIVLDEFHHAAADTYRRVLRHFEPRYLLGMTATPERTDGQDVLELCDRTIAYELRLLEAVDRGWLAPFQYYALYDPTDYDEVRWTGLGYHEEVLQQHLSTDTRADLIVRNLAVYQPALESRAAIAFCSNVGHARWMARAFRARGLEAAPLTGETRNRPPNPTYRGVSDALIMPDHDEEGTTLVGTGRRMETERPQPAPVL